MCSATFPFEIDVDHDSNMTNDMGWNTETGWAAPAPEDTSSGDAGVWTTVSDGLAFASGAAADAASGAVAVAVSGFGDLTLESSLDADPRVGASTESSFGAAVYSGIFGGDRKKATAETTSFRWFSTGSAHPGKSTGAERKHVGHATAAQEHWSVGLCPPLLSSVCAKLESLFSALCNKIPRTKQQTSRAVKSCFGFVFLGIQIVAWPMTFCYKLVWNIPGLFFQFLTAGCEASLASLYANGIAVFLRRMALCSDLLFAGPDGGGDAFETFNTDIFPEWRGWTNILMVFFSLVTIILMMNMLIAMMTETIARVQVETQMAARFARAQFVYKNDIVMPVAKRMKLLDDPFYLELQFHRREGSLSAVESIGALMEKTADHAAKFHSAMAESAACAGYVKCSVVESSSSSARSSIPSLGLRLPSEDDLGGSSVEPRATSSLPDRSSSSLLASSDVVTGAASVTARGGDGGNTLCPRGLPVIIEEIEGSPISPISPRGVPRGLTVPKSPTAAEKSPREKSPRAPGERSPRPRGRGSSSKTRAWSSKLRGLLAQVKKCWKRSMQRKRVLVYFCKKCFYDLQEWGELHVFGFARPRRLADEDFMQAQVELEERAERAGAILQQRRLAELEKERERERQKALADERERKLRRKASRQDLKATRKMGSRSPTSMGGEFWGGGLGGGPGTFFGGGMLGGGLKKSRSAEMDRDMPQGVCVEDGSPPGFTGQTARGSVSNPGFLSSRVTYRRPKPKGFTMVKDETGGGDVDADDLLAKDNSAASVLSDGVAKRKPPVVFAASDFKMRVLLLNEESISYRLSDKEELTRGSFSKGKKGKNLLLGEGPSAVVSKLIGTLKGKFPRMFSSDGLMADD